ncbi:MAG: hypothetical protein F6J94_25705 [Moorea sp. SIO1F2]|uniref:hypothetical protein n=1 Tax=Moorena sp. SIO1F2 TaxID=2607819 RepID=UPI0013B8FEE0|nr:hypothetical protein [Moorena sp. SIO1F2]NET85184.1 hypothetical protein [Moorena sp. SIO1F2]
MTTGLGFCLFHPGDTRSRAELIEQLGETFDGVWLDSMSILAGRTDEKAVARVLGVSKY